MRLLAIQPDTESPVADLWYLIQIINSVGYEIINHCIAVGHVECPLTKSDLHSLDFVINSCSSQLKVFLMPSLNVTVTFSSSDYNSVNFTIAIDAAGVTKAHIFMETGWLCCSDTVLKWLVVAYGLYSSHPWWPLESFSVMLCTRLLICLYQVWKLEMLMLVAESKISL